MYYIIWGCIGATVKRIICGRCFYYIWVQEIIYKSTWSNFMESQKRLQVFGDFSMDNLFFLKICPYYITIPFILKFWFPLIYLTHTIISVETTTSWHSEVFTSWFRQASYVRTFVDHGQDLFALGHFIIEFSIFSPSNIKR